VTEKYELEKLFGARKQPQGFWLSDHFKHFVVAYVDSEAGRKYNDRSIEQIRTMIKGSNAAKHSDILSTIIGKIEILLGKVLVEEAPVKTNFSVKNSGQGYLGSLASGIIAMISSNREKPIEVLPQRRVNVQLEVQQLNIDKGQPLWFICPKSPLAENIALSKNLKFAEDGSVHVDYSSHFIPAVKVFRFEDGNIQIAVECPSCENSYTVTTQGGSVIIRGEKPISTLKDSEVYLNTHRAGQFKIEVPITSMEKNYVYDIRKKAIKNLYQNGVIVLTIKRLIDDDYDDL
jgi:HSP20 family molecular chaperone IbpA